MVLIVEGAFIAYLWLPKKKEMTAPPFHAFMTTAV